MATPAPVSGARDWSHPALAGPHARATARGSAPILTPTSAQAPRWHQRVSGLPIALGLLLLAGWFLRDLGWLEADRGIGYGLGFAAIGCMALLLLYPVRKRLRWLSFMGATRHWFQLHTTLGMLAPVAALYHCNFAVGSLNSEIALYSILLVAGSGFVGRFLYMRIQRDLNSQRREIRQARPKLAKAGVEEPLGFIALLDERLAQFEQDAIQRCKSRLAAFTELPGLPRRCEQEYRALSQVVQRHLARRAHRSPLVQNHRERLLGSTLNYLQAHFRQIRRACRLQVYERLFALWHVVHLPFFVLLILSVIVHVAAVHLY